MTEILSCFDAAASPEPMLPVAEGVARILAAVPQPTRTEWVPLAQAMGRVLAEDQISQLNVPPHTNSAMDGYAVRAADCAAPQRPALRLCGRVLAGQRYTGVLAPGEAVEIMTGAPLPAGADTVVIKEVAQVDGEWVSFQGAIQAGQHVRQAGEDIAAGAVAIGRGTLLRPQEMGLLASLGMQEVPVYRRLKAAIFSTGDEVRAQGESLPESCIYDTNRFTLHGMLQRLGCDVIDFGIIEDECDSMTRVLQAASDQADLVFSSGGVSLGQADYIKAALARVGHIGFWRIAMRPGRPLAFGHIGTTPFFGLPGNPVSVMVTFLQFAQPALRKMMGQAGWQPQRIVALAEADLASRVGRTDYSRGIFRIDPHGRLVVRATGAQGSGMLTSMVRANCLIEIGDEIGRVSAGEPVLIQPFADLI